MKEPNLTTLQWATDDSIMQSALSSVLRRNSNGRYNAPAKIRHRVIKYKVSKDNVIEYWCGSNSRHLNNTCIIGRLYHHNRGEKIFRNLKNLWMAAHGEDHEAWNFGMPRPLAYIPKLGMVFQTAVPGRQVCTFSEILPSRPGSING